MDQHLLMAAKPNIILITTDTQRCDTLGCMGSSYAVSPHLDQLAAEGVLFKEAYTASPVCSPARSSLITGLHTPVHGCIENGIQRRETFQTLPDLLKQEGYTNLMIGKTHFGNIPASFDIVHGIDGEKSANSSSDSYAQFLKPHGVPRKSEGPQSRPEHLHMEAFLINQTIEELEALREKNEGPFFAFCSLLSPHSPLDPPGDWAHLFRDKELPPVDYRPGDIQALPVQTKRLLGYLDREAEHEAWLETPEAQQEMDEERRLYYGLAAYTDAQIGRLLAYLDASGLRESTLVLFTSDHGEQMYDHGFSDKHNYYDATWRVPFIMSMPGTLPMGETRDFAVWTDITATILGAAGIHSRYVHGHDLFHPVKAGEPSPRSCAVGTLYRSAAIATKRWKLEYYFEEREGRLYDRLNDPSEREDLFSIRSHEVIKHELLEALLSWRSNLSDLQYLTESTGGGGPVARRIAPHTLLLSGEDNERRLSEKAKQIESMEMNNETQRRGIL
ncbi:sulfatase family protein [Paenibacillus cremeus]|uniref:Sulfatase-like hydrolase/transferase n=1 Tax=Paenibacillus cremeus TaxID=2163881 RepID=A0A559KG41_9BACL|nr:sulfatase-like hydrolase/transferase [Paenibacillus cremeus]TVY11097.1 sulfatase-like hydrolase/transferase [Paenibacillus cremeus]